MKTMKMATMAVGTGALLLAFAVAPAVMASAAPKSSTVPCTGQSALVAAVNAANAAGGGTLNLTPGCDYALTTPDNGENGLPVVTTSIAVNGNGATIDGTKTVRDFEVDGPGGSLSIQNLTLTGGSATDFGGGIANMGGTVVLNHSSVTNNAAVVGGGGIASATFDPSSVAKLTLNNSSVTNNSQTLSAFDNGVGGGGIVNMDLSGGQGHGHWPDGRAAQPGRSRGQVRLSYPRPARRNARRLRPIADSPKPD